jgi:hypothetical protein
VRTKLASRPLFSPRELPHRKKIYYFWTFTVWGRRIIVLQSAFISSTLDKMKLLSKAKEIKCTEIEKFGNALFDLLNRTSRPSMLSIKVIREPFYHSYPPSSLTAGCILLT